MVPQFRSIETVMRYLKPIFGLALGCFVAYACADKGTIVDPKNSQSKPAGPVLRAHQVIIKFRNASLDPSRPAYLEQLSRDVGAKLVYLRPMSGGAHVFSVSDPAMEGEQFDSVVIRLNKHADVEHAEPNRLLRHMQQK